MKMRVRCNICQREEFVLLWDKEAGEFEVVCNFCGKTSFTKDVGYFEEKMFIWQ